MSDADCTPGREPRSVAASYYYLLLLLGRIAVLCSLSVSLSRSRAVQEWLNWSRCCLGCGLWVCHSSEPCKNGSTDGDAFGRTPVGPVNHVLDGGQHPPWEEAILRGKGRPIVKYRVTLPWAVQKRLNRSRLLDAVWVVKSGGPEGSKVQSYSPGGANVPSWEGTTWQIWFYGLVSTDFDHLLLLYWCFCLPGRSLTMLLDRQHYVALVLWYSFSCLTVSCLFSYWTVANVHIVLASSLLMVLLT